MHVVTGGGTLGEGIQLWDFRNLTQPVRKMVWNTTQTGEIVNPIVNSVRFVSAQNLILAGCSDNRVSAKCFDSLTGEIVDEFRRV